MALRNLSEHSLWNHLWNLETAEEIERISCHTALPTQEYPAAKWELQNQDIGKVAYRNHK